MHGSPRSRSSSRTKARPLPRCTGAAARTLRPRALKDWTATCRCTRHWRRSRVDRPRAGLRHDHAPRRWSRRNRRSRGSRLNRRRRLGLWRGYRRSSSGGNNGLCRSRNRRLCHGSRGRRSHSSCRRNNHRPRCDHRNSRGRHGYRTVTSRPCRDSRRSRRNYGRTCDHRSNRGLTRDRRRCRWRNDIRSLPRQRNDPARCRSRA